MTDVYDELMQPLSARYGRRQTEDGSETIEVERTADVSDDDAAEVFLPQCSTVPQSQLAALHQQATQELKQQLLAHIYAQGHEFFENLIIDVLLAMGYGSRRRDLVKRIGRSHDGGIDGIISQDELGLDLILLQAKRLKPATSVSVSQVRDFVGSLDLHHANKGIFFTTAHFSASAQACVKSVSRRVVLVNGEDLTSLMVRHGIGVTASESYVFKRIERSYFSPALHGHAGVQMHAKQPRH